MPVGEYVYDAVGSLITLTTMGIRIDRTGVPSSVPIKSKRFIPRFDESPMICTIQSTVFPGLFCITDKPVINEATVQLVIWFTSGDKNVPVIKSVSFSQTVSVSHVCVDIMIGGTFGIPGLEIHAFKIKF